MSLFYPIIFSLSIAFTSACSCRGNSTLAEQFCLHQVVAKVRMLHILTDDTDDQVTASDEAFMEGASIGGNVGNVQNSLTNLLVTPVLKVKLARRSDQGYRLQFIKVYRNSTGKRLDSIVYTRATSSQCGYRFDLGNEYLMFADITGDGKVRSGLCSGNAHWSHLSKETVLTLDNMGSNGDHCVRKANGDNSTSKNVRNNGGKERRPN